MKRSNRIALVKRSVFLCVGLTIMAFGVGFSIKAGLGTSPISSVPYALNQITPLTVGTATIAMHCVFIVLQILLLRSRYDPIQLMQLPVALIFGALTDGALWGLQGVSASGYPMRWVLCAVGILLVGVGVSFEVTANVVTLAGEGVVLAVCKAFSTQFARTKVCFDVTLVVVACLLSLGFLGHLEGVREGTVAAAILVGPTSKRVSGGVQRLARCWLGEGAETSCS